MSVPAAPRPDAADGWDEVLQRLEDDLARIEGALDAGEPVTVAPWEPPTGLGPVPDAARDRAVDLLARLQDVADEVRAARSLSLEEVQRTRQRRDAAVAYHAAG